LLFLLAHQEQSTNSHIHHIPFIHLEPSTNALGVAETRHNLTEGNNLSTNTLILSGRNSTYTCFVDFKSAFDTVSRTALIYKVIKMGIGGCFVDILIDMYSDVQYCVKQENGYTNSFSSNIGVKQGCVLSPTLFNMLIKQQ